MKKLFAALLALVSSIALATTTVPVQLLNPTGSTSGQAIVSAGPGSPPSWSSTFGPSTFTTLAVVPGAASLTLGITETQSVTGTTSSNCTSTTGIVYPCANSFYVSSDNVNAGTGATSAYDEWQFAANFGGSSLSGARQVMDVIGNFTAPSSASNGNRGYVAIAGEMITNSGDGGTAPTVANGKGSFFGMNPLVIANSGATNLFGIAGVEIDVGCNSCTSAIRFGVSSANFGTTQAAVLANDAAYHVGSLGPGTAGAWHQAINLSNVNGGAPLDTAGCVICTDTTANTIATGMDLSAYTISGNFLNGPGGNFKVTGAGVATTSNDKVIATNTSTQSIPNNSATVVTNWTSVLNQGAHFVPATGVYTAPVAGQYRVSAQLQYTGAAFPAGAFVTVEVFQNGSLKYLTTHITEAAVTAPLYTQPISVVLNCAANDTISVAALQTQGGAVALNNSAVSNYLMIEQLP